MWPKASQREFRAKSRRYLNRLRTCIPVGPQRDIHAERQRLILASERRKCGISECLTTIHNPSGKWGSVTIRRNESATRPLGRVRSRIAVGMVTAPFLAFPLIDLFPGVASGGKDAGHMRTSSSLVSCWQLARSVLVRIPAVLTARSGLH
jgi:hypothetical protein